MISRVSTLVVALALVVFAAGCSKAPEGELKASEEAIQEALVAEAGAYAPELYRQALDTLNAAKIEIQKQDARFSAFRSYGSSEQFLATAQRLADSAITETNLARERVRQQDSALVVEIDSLLAAADDAIATAPTGKGTRADVELLKSQLGTLRAEYMTAVNTMNGGDYLAARTELEAVTTHVSGLIESIETVKARTSTRPKS